MCIINPLYFSPQVKNKPYKPTGKYAFILENGVVVNITVVVFRKSPDESQFFSQMILEGFRRKVDSKDVSELFMFTVMHNLPKCHI